MVFFLLFDDPGTCTCTSHAKYHIFQVNALSFKDEQIALTHITIVNSQKVKIMPTNVANPALWPLIKSMIVESCEFVD